MWLIVRAFVPSSSDVHAQKVAKRLCAKLAGFGAVEAEPPQSYWKIPEWYEHSIHLSPATLDAFQAVIAMAASGWTHVEDDFQPDSVWNAGHGSEFLLPEVTWAQVMLVPRTRAHLVYLRSNKLVLSREPVTGWRDLQKRHDEYMASLGPWTLDEITDHLAVQFGDENQWPLRRAAIEQFMTSGSDLVLRPEG